MNSKAVVNQARLKRLYFNGTGTPTDGQLPLMQIRYIGDDATHTYTLDNNGSSSELLITLTDVTTGASTIIGNTSDTLTTLIAAINAIPSWEARRYNGPADYDTGTDDFIDVAATSIGREWTNALYRDSSEIFGTTGRIAIPQMGDKGMVTILKVEGQATGASTDPWIKIIRDTTEASADGEEVVLYKELTTDTETDIWDFTDIGGLSFQGPILIEVGSATGSMPTACDIRVLYSNGEATA